MRKEEQFLYLLRQLRFSRKYLVLWKAQLGTWESVWNAPEALLLKCSPDMNRETIALLHRRHRGNLQDMLKNLKNHQLQFLGPEHHHFPQLLSQTERGPLGIFVKGNVGALAAVSPLAVVGTRRITNYGKQVLKELVPSLVKAGVTIVSGLAYGIDALAHQIALEHGGRCIAVLAHGLDEVHPTQHVRLAHRIVETGGCLVSEYPIGMQALPGLFPARNRIISGLSRGTLVVEASLKSGSLITARYALDQNRDVYAVPGNIFGKQQQGANRLLSEGAHAVLSPTDLLEKLSLDAALSYRPEQRSLSFENPDEQRVYDALSEPQEIQALSEYCKVAMDKLGIMLSMMEIKGLIQNLGPGVYGRN